MSSLVEAIAGPVPLLLDGAIGTELAARGFSTDRPGWSVAATWEAPALLCEVYRDYVAAGSDAITANTFRAHASTLATLTETSQREVIAECVQLVRRAEPRFVLGSIGTVADCYSPNLVPDDRTLASEHAKIAEALAAADVDGVVLETMNTAREAMIALQCARDRGLVVIASLWSADGYRMGDGVPIEEAARQLREQGAAAVCINCLAADEISPVLGRIAGSVVAEDVFGEEGGGANAVGKVGRFGAYGNTGKRVGDGWQTTAASAPTVYADLAEEWIAKGAALVGGCCMTTPGHIREIRNRIDALAFSRAIS